MVLLGEVGVGKTTLRLSLVRSIAPPLHSVLFAFSPVGESGTSGEEPEGGSSVPYKRRKGTPP